MRLLLFILFICVLNNKSSREYIKNYDAQGMLIEEGWMQSGIKNGYWKFYKNGSLTNAGAFNNNQKTGYWYEYDQGKVKSEGSYLNNLKHHWWICHNKVGYKKIKKQFSRGTQSGYVLFYKKRALSKVAEYKNNRKLGEWSSILSFKRDHPDLSIKQLKAKLAQ